MKPKNRPVSLIFIVFFLSGMAGLIYEISWTRQIGLLLGHTVGAASTVLASYFAGMGLGYVIGAKLTPKINPVVGYAVAEVLIGAWGIAIVWIIGLSETPVISALLSSENWAWQTFARGVFCFVVMLPATIAMGATLPMMAEFLAQNTDRSKASSRISMAYSLNTAGALAGTLLSTFVLLINVGVSRSSFIAVGLSWLCAATALATVAATTKDSSRNNLVESTGKRLTLSSEILSLAFFSGFGTLALQVLFTRMFALVFHNSTYTFGVVVAVFLAALAIGAAAASLLQRHFPPRKILIVAIALGTVLTPVSVVAFVQMTELSYFSSGASFVGYITSAIGLVAICIGPAIVCLGMVLPLVWTLSGVSDDAGSVVGMLTSVNTMGAALGALAASFLMLVYVGLWPSIVVVALGFLILGVRMLLASRQRVLAIVLTGLMVSASAVALRSPNDAQHAKETLGEEIVKRFHSSYGWIDVVKFSDQSTFKIRQNLHYRFGRTGGNVREFRQAHIPLLIANDPQSVLFLGLGTGLTAGGAVPHQGLKSIDAVELIPEVVDAARMLAKYNNNIVDHPKTSIHVDDARHFLLANPNQYDVIVSDLFVPWESESGYLYTVQHYRVAKDRLNQDGLFCQWLPLYQMGEVEFESIANSFAKVFPHTTLWWAQMSQRKPVVALIGSRHAIAVNAERLIRDIDLVNRNRSTADPSIATLQRFWGLYAGDWNPTSTTGLNTDEFPRVEFLTPVSNRNRQLLSGPNFEDYYRRRLGTLADDDATLTGVADLKATDVETTDQRRARQRLILFGSAD